MTSTVGQGATFHLYFPAATTATPDSAGSATAESARGGPETILLAEDHEGLRDLVRESLESPGYRVLVASDGEEAVELYRRNAGAVDLLILDVVMPRLRGPGAYQRIRDLRGAVPVLFCTGYNPDCAQVESLSDHPVLQKPYPAREPAHTVRRILDQRPRRGS